MSLFDHYHATMKQRLTERMQEDVIGTMVIMVLMSFFCGLIFQYAGWLSTVASAVALSAIGYQVWKMQQRINEDLSDFNHYTKEMIKELKRGGDGFSGS